MSTSLPALRFELEHPDGIDRTHHPNLFVNGADAFNFLVHGDLLSKVKFGTDIELTQHGEIYGKFWFSNYRKATMLFMSLQQLKKCIEVLSFLPDELEGSFDESEL
jgi:hypothetical protein